ncbi:TonB-dependent receptor [Pseudoalteromonas xiamenensis]
MSSPTRFLSVPSLITILLIAAPTYAQVEVQSEHISKAKLEKMQGQSALDIIKQVSGFLFINSNDKRGLSGATGNVLINGLPVLSKSQSLESILADFPVEQLLELDVYRAGHPFSSASHHTQVINLTRDTSNRQFNWRVEALSQSNYQGLKSTSLQGVIASGSWEHQLRLSRSKSHWQSKLDLANFDASGLTDVYGEERYQEETKKSQIGLVSTKRFDQSVLSLNLQWLKSEEKEGFRRKSQRLDLTSLLETNRDSLDTQESSFGFDWQQTQQQALWQWQVTGLIRQIDSTQLIVDTSVQNEQVEKDAFLQDKLLKERVLRISRLNSALWWQPELGLEISQNTLNADTFDTITLNTTVKELRVEPFVSARFDIATNWQLFSKLVVEQAKLESESNSFYETTERYWKPLLKLTHKAENGVQSTYGLQRKVEQLNFDDFVASQDSAFGREQSGNAELKPRQSWEVSYEANFETAFGITVNTKLFWEWQRDVHEYVQFDDENWGIANAGKADYYGGNLELNVPMDWLIDESQINVLYEYRDANFADPLTGKRVTSDLMPHFAEIEYRKEGQWYALGAVTVLSNHVDIFYPDEQYQEQHKTTLKLYGEFQLPKDMQLNIEVADSTRGHSQFRRNVYSPYRGEALEYRFVSNEHFEPSISASLSGQF